MEILAGRKWVLRKKGGRGRKGKGKRCERGGKDVGTGWEVGVKAKGRKRWERDGKEVGK